VAGSEGMDAPFSIRGECGDAHWWDGGLACGGDSVSFSSPCSRYWAGFSWPCCVWWSG